MDIKLIAFDLDGTLLAEDHQIDKNTLAAIEKVRAKGVKVLVATGRMYRSTKTHTDRLNVTEPIITYNGALVVNPINQEQIFHVPIPFEIAKKITKMVQENDYHLQLYINDELFVSETNKYTDRYVEISGIEANLVDNLVDALNDEPTKMLIIEDDEDKLLEIKNFLLENFPGQIEISSSYPSFIEITKKGISKALALEKVAAELGIKKEEVMAFGDGLNDLKMIQWVGKGIAMENAHSELLEYADDIAPGHDKSGIARYLKKEFKLDLDIEN